MNIKYINYIFSGFVIILCLVWSYFLLFSDEFVGNIPNTQRKIFVGILLLYAAFRGFRLYTLIQQNKINNNK